MVCPWLENGTVTSFMASHHDLNGYHRLQLVSPEHKLAYFHIELFARSVTLLLVSTIVGTLTLLKRIMLKQTAEVHSQSIVHGDLTGVSLIHAVLDRRPLLTKPTVKYSCLCTRKGAPCRFWPFHDARRTQYGVTFRDWGCKMGCTRTRRL
jgi:hypothetical protein